jgi:hypothetical protein
LSQFCCVPLCSLSLLVSHFVLPFQFYLQGRLYGLSRNTGVSGQEDHSITILVGPEQVCTRCCCCCCCCDTADLAQQSLLCVLCLCVVSTFWGWLLVPHTWVVSDFCAAAMSLQHVVVLECSFDAGGGWRLDFGRGCRSQKQKGDTLKLGKQCCTCIIFTAFAQFAWDITCQPRVANPARTCRSKGPKWHHAV